MFCCFRSSFLSPKWQSDWDVTNVPQRSWIDLGSLYSLSQFSHFPYANVAQRNLLWNQSKEIIYTYSWGLEAGSDFLTYAVIDKHLLGICLVPDALMCPGSSALNHDSGSEVACWGWRLESSSRKVLQYTCEQHLLGTHQQREWPYISAPTTPTSDFFPTPGNSLTPAGRLKILLNSETSYWEISARTGLGFSPTRLPYLIQMLIGSPSCHLCFWPAGYI